MQYKTLAALFFAATALAAPATTEPSSDLGESSDPYDDDDSFDIGDVPSSILTVLATAIPDSWYSDIMDDSSRSAIVSAAEAGTYPAWYNSLPSSVKAWATSNFEDDVVGASSTLDSIATSASGSATATGSSSAIETGAGASTTATQTSSGAAKTSGSSSDSSSSSASTSASASQSTGGAPSPTGGVAMGVAGAAGVLAFALAL